MTVTISLHLTSVHAVTIQILLVMLVKKQLHLAHANTVTQSNVVEEDLSIQNQLGPTNFLSIYITSVRATLRQGHLYTEIL